MKTALAIAMFVGAGASDIMDESFLQVQKNSLVGIGADDFGTEGEEEFSWSMAAITKKQYGGEHEDARNMNIQKNKDTTENNKDSKTSSDMARIQDDLKKTFSEENDTSLKYGAATLLQSKAQKNLLVGIGADDFGTEGEEEFAWSMAAITKKQYGGEHEDARNMNIQKNKDTTENNKDSKTSSDMARIQDDLKKTFSEENDTSLKYGAAALLQSKAQKNSLVGIGADDFGTEGEEEFAWSMAAITKKQYGGEHEDARNMNIQKNKDTTENNKDSKTSSDMARIQDDLKKTFNEVNDTSLKYGAAA